MSDRIYVARQAVFDANLDIFGYELLFRNGHENRFPKGTNKDTASSSVIADALTVFGYDALSGGRMVFVNCSQQVLENRDFDALPPSNTVLEVLETVAPTTGVLDALSHARDRGFTIAVDDFEYRSALEPLLALADIVKVDFQALNGARRQCQYVFLRRVMRPGAVLLAEKVEGDAAFQQAKVEGHRLFQGHHFARPEVMTRTRISLNQSVYLAFLRALQEPRLDFDALDAIIKRDVGLSVKLLRYLNGRRFSWRREVTSLRDAIVRLGEGHSVNGRRWSR